MAPSRRTTQLQKKRICYNCVGETLLRDEIRNRGRAKKCSYCGSVQEQCSVGELAERVASAFEHHYAPCEQKKRKTQPVVRAIASAAKIPELAARDIQEILEETSLESWSFESGTPYPFDFYSFYERKGLDDFHWQDQWEELEDSLKTRARFFSRSVEQHLAHVFKDIGKLQATDGRPIVIDAGVGTAMSVLYRARVFQSSRKLESALAHPDSQLGPPPSMHANPGRMNARGISVFYAATTPKVAIAEVRPPVGSRVVVAKFHIVRRIHLLDLAALSLAASPIEGSIFDVAFTERVERTMFLRNLSGRIARPVTPDDEPSEFIATQAIADYLAAQVDPPLDGIVFPSAQAAGAGLNVVLFHKAAGVEGIEMPEGTTVSTRLHPPYEDWTKYSVIETLPETPRPRRERELWEIPGAPELGATLKIDLESIAVHRIKAIHVRSSVHPVPRTRENWSEPPF